LQVGKKHPETQALTQLFAEWEISKKI
jgi:hypothetical protein